MILLSKKQMTNPVNRIGLSFLVVSFLFIFLFMQPKFLGFQSVQAQDKESDLQLTERFIQAKGMFSPIIFDATNIKQFWIDKSVASLDGKIRIQFSEGKKTRPLRIQLANVNEAQDCQIDIITKETDLDLQVCNSNGAVISLKSEKEDFLNYHIISSVVHLEEANDFSFDVLFSSNTLISIDIEKIILSFSSNKDSSFLLSPNHFSFSKDDLTLRNCAYDKRNGLVIKGITSILESKKKLLVSDCTFSASCKVSNVGETPVKIYLGYTLYDKNRKKIDNRNYPYASSPRNLTVLASEVGSDKIIVDSMEQWRKDCFIAYEIKDDFTDIPFSPLLKERVVEMKQLPDGTAEITLQSPLTESLEKGTSIRINGPGGQYLYTNVADIKPQEEISLKASISRDLGFNQYSSKALSRGIYYILPVMLSFSQDSKTENIIEIKELVIDF